MNFINKHKKHFCGIVSAAMLIGTSGAAVFAAGSADEPQTDYTVSTAEATAAPDATATPEASAQPTAAPETKNIDIDITATVYTTDDKNKYKVSFKTDSTMPLISEFEFTTTYASGTIESIEFGSSFESNGTTSKSITDDKTVKYTWKGETPVSGSVVLASAYVSSASTLTDKNISVDSFTAVGSDGTEYIINPALTIAKGVNMPDLKDNEQAAYDALIALPSVDALTFYEGSSDSLCDLKLKYAQPIDTALASYEKLTNTSKKNVDTALSINNITITDIENVQASVKAMQEVFGIMELPDCYTGITDNSDAVNYQYLTETFNNLSTSAPGALEKAPQAYKEFNTAVTDIKGYNEIVNKQVALIADKTYENYQLRIASLKTQFEAAKSHSQVTLAKAFLSSITMLAEELYDDIDTNYTGSYKEYMLSDIEKIVDEINAGDDIYKYLPTFEAPSSVRIGLTWNVYFKRTKQLQQQDAKVEVYAYKQNGSLAQTNSSSLKAGDLQASVSLVSRNTIYTANEIVNVKCYYVYNGISYYLGSSTMTTKPQSSTNSGTSTGGSSSGGSGGGSTTTGSGDLYPTFAPDAPKPTKAPNMANDNPYTDINGYDWAYDAIIGLTNAGIVNGMGENEFNPAGNVTREQFCKMVVQLFGVSTNETKTDFVDVDETAWYAPYITAAVQAGYVQGQSDEYFGIGEVIMRQDMATILYRAANQTGDGVALNFTDNNDIAAYAKDAISEFVGLGVMNGYSDGSFKPRGSATRAEAAKVIWGIYEIVR